MKIVHRSLRESDASKRNCRGSVKGDNSMVVDAPFQVGTGLLGVALRAVVMMGIVGPLLMGCGFHLYNAERDKVAQQTKEKFAATDVLGVIKTARDNNARMTTGTLEALKRGDLALRDEKLWGVAVGSPTVNEIVSEVAGRQLQLVGGQRANLNDVAMKLSDDAAQLQAERTAVSSDSDIIRIAYGFSAPTCESVAADHDGNAQSGFITRAAARIPTTGPKPEDIFKDYLGHCRKLLSRQAALLDGMRGQIGGGAVTAWNRERTELASLRQEAARLKVQADAAAAEYKSAAGELANDRKSMDFQGKAKDALEALGDALNALAEGADAIGVKLASEERLKEIQEALKALSGEANDDEKSLASLAALAGLPHLADEALVVIKNLNSPRVTPLLIEKERQSYLLKVAENSIQRREQRVALRKQLIDAMVEEAFINSRIMDALCDALRTLGERATCDAASKFAPKQEFTLAAALDKANTLVGPSKNSATQSLWQGLTEYGHLYTVQRPDERQIEARIAATFYDGSLNESETALQLWQAFIAAPIDQLVAYHATGIKPEDAAQLIVQAIGLGSIGIGVNR